MAWMTAVEALKLLNVRPQTLYANVSRSNGRRKVEAVSAQATLYGADQRRNLLRVAMNAMSGLTN